MRFLKALMAFMLLLFIPSYYWSQDSVVKFFHQYSIQNTITECNNTQLLHGKNKLALAFDIAFGVAITKGIWVFYPNISIGRQNNTIQLSYIGNDLPTYYILNYWYIKNTFNLGLKINSRKKISFIYSLLYSNNGGMRYSGKNANSREELYVTIPKSYLNYGVGIEYSIKLNETSNTQFFYKFETFLQQKQFDIKPNNNYFNINRSYKISYQTHILSIGLRFNGLKRKNKEDDY